MSRASVSDFSFKNPYTRSSQSSVFSSFFFFRFLEELGAGNCVLFLSFFIFLFSKKMKFTKTSK